MKMTRTLWTMAATLCLATGALAQMPGGGAPSPEMIAAREAMQKACDADMKKLCSGKDGREAMQCLRSSMDKASASCKDAMAKMPMRPQRP